MEPTYGLGRVPTRDVLLSLPNRDPLTGRAGSAAAEASCGVLTGHWSNRVHIHGGRNVIGLIAEQSYACLRALVKVCSARLK